jgi:hypothetical protein
LAVRLIVLNIRLDRYDIQAYICLDAYERGPAHVYPI